MVLLISIFISSIIYLIYLLFFAVKCPDCGLSMFFYSMRDNIRDQTRPYRIESKWKPHSNYTERILMKMFPLRAVYDCCCGKTFYAPRWTYDTVGIPTGDSYKAKRCKNCNHSGSLEGETSGGLQFNYSKTKYEVVGSQDVSIKCKRCGGKGWYKKE